jgi:hypothetical protein
VRKSRSPLRGGGQDNRSHGDDQSYDVGDEEDPIGPVAAEMKGHGALLRRSGFQVSTAGRLLSRSYPPFFCWAKIGSPDPLLTSVCSLHAPQPLLPLFDPPVELAAW